MEKMRVTTHNGRTNKQGKAYSASHNDRSFDKEKASNINSAKTTDNINWNCYNDPQLTFAEAELKAYNELFGEQLEKTNANYIKNGHSERVKTMEQWIKQPIHAPVEQIRQIGNAEQANNINLQIYQKVEKTYQTKMNEWNTAHGNIITVLDRSIHTDEQGTIHTHEREVYSYTDDKGNVKIGQEKALKQAGVQLPDPTQPEGRYNNRKITFDSMRRQWWIDSCKEHGLNIEEEPVPDAKHNLTKEELIRGKNKKLLEENKKLEEIKQQNQKIILEQNQNESLKMHQENEKLEEEIKGLKEKNKELKTENQELKGQNKNLVWYKKIYLAITSKMASIFHHNNKIMDSKEATKETIDKASYANVNLEAIGKLDNKLQEDINLEIEEIQKEEIKLEEDLEDLSE